MKLLTAALLLLVPLPASAQNADEGTFVVRRAGQEIAREEFTVRTGQPRPDGVTIVSTAQYGGAAAPLRLTGVLERNPGGRLTSVRVDHDSGKGPSRFRVEMGRDVLVVHQVGEGTESAREMPGSPDMLSLDEGLYAFYLAVADRAGENGVRVHIIYPRTGRRATVTLRRIGEDGSPRVELTGDITGTLRLDAMGRVVRMEFPDRSIEVVRLRP
jgi:hypothetical protein